MDFVITGGREFTSLIIINTTFATKMAASLTGAEYRETDYLPIPVLANKSIEFIYHLQTIA